MVNKEKNELLDALFNLADFKIIKNQDKKDLSKLNPGWHETEDDYQKKQAAWLKKIKNKK